MKHRPTLASVLLLITSVGWCQTAPQIMEKYIAALGGREALLKLTSLKATGLIKGPGTDVPVTLVWSKPNRLRMELTIQGNRIVQVYDGQKAASFISTPTTGYKEPLEVSAEDAANLAKSAAGFDMTEYLKYNEAGATVELLAPERLGDKDLLKLRWKKTSGEVVTMWLDPTSYLEVREDSLVPINGNEYETTSLLSEYRRISGVMFAFRMESRPKGAAQGVALVFSSVETNLAVPEVTFTTQ